MTRDDIIEREKFDTLLRENDFNIERRDGCNSLQAGDYKDPSVQALWDWHTNNAASRDGEISKLVEAVTWFLTDNSDSGEVHAIHAMQEALLPFTVEGEAR